MKQLTARQRIPIRVELQDSLLAAGAQHLAARSHHALTLRSLASMVGVSHTTAAAQFGSMPGYLAALATRLWESLVARLEACPVDVVALAQAYVEFAIDHPYAFRLMHDTAVGSSEAAAVTEPAGKQACFEFFIRAVKRGQGEGTIRAGNSRVIAQMPAALAHGLAIEFLQHERTGRPVNLTLLRQEQIAEAGEILYLAMLGLVA